MAKILIVDDEFDLCQEFSNLLEDDGHQVDTAENGLVAIDKFSKNEYDIIFLDVLMPKMEGREVLEIIRQKSQTPVAIISAYLSAEREKEALRLGAVACFHKPFDVKIVKRLIDKVIANKELKQ